LANGWRLSGEQTVGCPGGERLALVQWDGDEKGMASDVSLVGEFA
jgi:hypothetical protein